MKRDRPCQFIMIPRVVSGSQHTIRTRRQRDACDFNENISIVLIPTFVIPLFISNGWGPSNSVKLALNADSCKRK